VEVGSAPTVDRAHNVSLDRGFAYVTDYLGGVRMFDVRDPAAPVEVGYYELGYRSRTPDFDADYVYIATQENGLQILRNDLLPDDIEVTLTPRSAPISLPAAGGTFQFDVIIENNSAQDITADVTIEAVLPTGVVYPVRSYPGRLLAAGAYHTRVGMTQVVPSGAPAGTYVYRLRVEKPGSRIADWEEFTFRKTGGAAVAGRTAGWELSGWDDQGAGDPVQAARPILNAAAPNPFNPSTTISFELPGPAGVTLDIFDVRGRRISSLISGQDFSSGTHTVTWRGEDQRGGVAPAGVYYVRMQAAGTVRIQRLTMVK